MKKDFDRDKQGSAGKAAFDRWLSGDTDPLSRLPEAEEKEDMPLEDRRARRRAESARVAALPETEALRVSARRVFRAWYRVVAVVCCLALMAVFLYMTAHISRYGQENPRATLVSDRYVREGLEETGAMNIVAGMILDYRAFDTLGESHVLFTALLCVIVLLSIDKKNMHTPYGDYAQIRLERYFPTEQDTILHKVGLVLSPCIMLYGVYVLLGGHLGPGGGFSGGVVLGTGLIILSASLGDQVMDRFLPRKRYHTVLLAALSFYSFAKGYVFFTGANGIENHIPKGAPGAILSGGLILPLDIAVGLVVCCTMFGFYNLFYRGGNGEDSYD